MSTPDDESFLARWSRRKQESAQNEPGAPPQADAPAADAGANAVAANTPAAPPAEPAFDLSQLPSLETISADTDISAFLRPGVPSELRHAALRRAWVADPAIRDFRGLQENDWDFTNPNSAFGFGDLDPGTDLAKMVRRVFGESEPADPAPHQLPAPPAAPNVAKEDALPPVSSAAVASPEGAAVADEAALPPPDLLRNGTVVAPRQGEGASHDDAAPLPRRHGGALPKV